MTCVAFVSSRDYSPIKRVEQNRARTCLTGLHDGQVMESSIIFLHQWLGLPALPARHKCVPAVQGPLFVCHGDISSAAIWGRTKTASFLSPVAPAAAILMLLIFSSITRLTLLWESPARCPLSTPRERLSPKVCCWAGAAERCGVRRCWDVWPASVGRSVSSPCRPRWYFSSSSAPSASSSQPTSYMASSGSWSHQEGVYPEPREHPPTPMTQGSLHPDCCLCGLSQGALGQIPEGQGQNLLSWCLWKANILNWGRRLWPFWSLADSGTRLKSLLAKGTCPHWRTKKRGVLHLLFMRTFSSMSTWTPGTESCWTNTVWNME